MSTHAKFVSQVLSYPAPDPETSPTSSPDAGDKGGKGKKDDKKKDAKVRLSLF